jgi:hypothetical protein
VNLNRHTYVCEKIVFTDGISGTGKSILMPLLGTFKRVELARLEHTYEYLCIIDYLKKMDKDASECLIRMIADLAIFNSMISRDTNFRLKDQSGVFSNPEKIRYIRRLFYNDGDIVLERIKQQKPILHIVSHQVLGTMDLGFRAFGDRLRIIEMVRHPLYLIDPWISYIDRYGTDMREFTVWIDYNGKALPWFAVGWEKKYLESNSMDRVIYSLYFLFKEMDKFVSKLSQKQKKQILYVPFEKFVLDPYPYVDKMCDILDTEKTAKTKSVLKQQKCPRKQVAAGPVVKVFIDRYGWTKPEKGATEKVLLKQKREVAAKQASKEALKVLDNMCNYYEEKYGLWF